MKFVPVLNLVLRTPEKPEVTQLRNRSGPRPGSAAVSGAAGIVPQLEKETG